MAEGGFLAGAFAALGWTGVGLAIVIVIAVIVLILRLRRVTGGGGGPTDEALKAMQDVRDLLTEIDEAGRKPTPEECTRLRELIEAARSGGVGTLTLKPLVDEIDKMCNE